MPGGGGVGRGLRAVGLQDGDPLGAFGAPGDGRAEGFTLQLLAGEQLAAALLFGPCGAQLGERSSSDRPTSE